MRHAFLLAISTAIAAAPAIAFQTTSTSPDWDLIKKESEARKAAADARAAESAAETAAAKAQFGTLADVTREGKTDLGDKAGQLESAILSAESTRGLSALIVRDVCIRAEHICLAQRSETAVLPDGQPSGPKRLGDAQSTAPEIPPPSANMCGDVVAAASGTVRLYIVTEAEKLNFDTADVVQASLCGAQKQLERAIANASTATDVLAAGFAGVLTALNIAGNLLRTDYAVQGVAVTADDLLLAKAVATAAQGRIAVPTMIPAIYRPTGLTADNPLLQAIGAIDQLRDQATDLATSHRAEAARLAKKGKPFEAQAKEEADKAAKLEAAIKNYQDYLTKVTTPSDKGTSEFAEAARQARIRADLAAGSYILSVKMNATGGTTYTKKNFFASMIGIPFHISGGSVGSFTLIEGSSGAVRGAGTYAQSAGFEQIGKLHRSRSQK